MVTKFVVDYDIVVLCHGVSTVQMSVTQAMMSIKIYFCSVSYCM